MKIEFIQPKPELPGLVDSFWVFESDDGLPRSDSRVIGPRGGTRMIVPYRNTPHAKSTRWEDDTKESRIYFVGPGLTTAGSTSLHEGSPDDDHYR